MIRAYGLASGAVVELPLAPGVPLPEGTVWIDLLHPDDAERAHVATVAGIEPPTREEMKEIEVSSRLYAEGPAAYMTAPVITRADTEHPELGPITFILTQKLLVTVRFVEPKSVATFTARIRRQPDLLAGPEEAMLNLLDAIIDRAADVLELIGGRLDELGRCIFVADPTTSAGRRDGGAAGRPAALTDVMRSIGQVGDLTHKTRDSLAGLDRLLAYFVAVHSGRLGKEQKALLKTLTRDLRSISEHAAFLANQTGFLLDATLGVINIEQNAIIKIFSVVAVVFLPPTLIASIYGMNFEVMPELEWPLGYPLALLMMVVSAIVPLAYFRRKGWL
ncbi:magnesium transporter CorA family protein [Arenibaculum sp.]|jgi:magnesium transporter|uniref:magnesium transporter CorA family protein n=1 Tax=Arenibaculum sp. TaxID=2865862 RepID=UPI002E109F56|nr:magnesium transporter CorA family protein [Arenibaculum sp.]